MALAPMLCGSTTPPSDPVGWQREPKWDGIRTIVELGPDQPPRLWSRLGNEVTAAYPELSRLRFPEPCTLDGEVVAPDEGGVSRFDRLQHRMHVRRPSADLVRRIPVQLVVFDLLLLDGRELWREPLQQRRAELGRLFADAPAGPLQLSPTLPAEATHEELLAACRAAQLEGYVAKRLDGRYEPGTRSPSWVKVKATCRREVVVGGWIAGEGRMAGRVGSLAVGWVDPALRHLLPDGPALRYCGRVGSGMSQKLADQLQPVLQRFATDEDPFVEQPSRRSPEIHPVTPVLVVEVEYRQVTPEGVLRQPSIKGVRTDVRVADVGPGEGLGEGRGAP